MRRICVLATMAILGGCGLFDRAPEPAAIEKALQATKEQPFNVDGIVCEKPDAAGTWRCVFDGTMVTGFTKAPPGGEARPDYKRARMAAAFTRKDPAWIAADFKVLTDAPTTK